MKENLYVVETLDHRCEFDYKQPIVLKHIVVAESLGKAGKKIREHLNMTGYYKAKELKARHYMSLEMRLEILEEVFGKDKIIK